MATIKIINQNKYFKVIEIFGFRFINVKRPGVCIKVEGVWYYKLPFSEYQTSMLVAKSL